MPSISPGTFIETLVLFPVKLVPGATNIKDENALPRIMANEASLADEANITRESAKYGKWEIQNNIKKQAKQDLKLKQNEIYRKSFIHYFHTAMVSSNYIYLYKNMIKRFKHSFEGKYYRELPGEYTPAEMSVLMSFGIVNTRDVMATLMDLTRKKQLIILKIRLVKRVSLIQRKRSIYNYFK